MFQKDLLHDKRILITGGGTGLGKATAQRFLELGAEVYICGRREEVLLATRQELHERTGGKIHSRPCDVRDAAAVEEMIEIIWAEGPLDVLMNNAAGNFLARTEELSLGAFQSVPLAFERSRRRGIERYNHVHDDGVGLRGAIGSGKSRRTSSHAKPGSRVGQSGNSDERHRAWTNSDRGRVLATAATPGTRGDGKETKSSRTIWHKRRVCRPSFVSG
jgi:NAD(P)-dependent dehydrogenase (short-subunit alcohol dehydrogenase family)